MELEEIPITIDELEAIRLADYEGLYHEEAAVRMKISRQTFGRILNDAHKKVAECLIKGKALKINTYHYSRNMQIHGTHQSLHTVS